MKRMLVLLIVLASSSAHATWKLQYASEPQDVQDWYASAQVTEAAQKRLGFVPCCDTSEVVKTQFRVDRKSGEDQWFYLEHGTWKQVPPDIIHYGESAPDNQPTLFIIKDETADVWHLPHGTPSCFYPPAGGL